MNPQDKNLDREGGKKCTYPRCACDSKAACTVPQAGAAVASDSRECERIADLPAVHEALTGFTQDPTGDNGTCVVRAVLEAISGKTIQAGASGAGEVKTWQERAGIEPNAVFLASWARPYMEAEITELRSQLASLNGQLAQCVAESAKWAAAAGAANAQLARLQAPVGEPVAYLRQSDLDRLSHPSVGGCGASLNKEPATGFVAIYTTPPSAQQEPSKQPELTVWYGPMPESNGKSNFTAVLMRKDDKMLDGFTDGITIDRSEYPDRVRYEADRVRYLIGELAERPDILAYDADKHSGYKKPSAQQEQGVAVRDALLFAADTIELFDDTTMQADYMRALPDYLALRATKTEGEEQQ